GNPVGGYLRRGIQPPTGNDGAPPRQYHPDGRGIVLTGPDLECRSCAVLLIKQRYASVVVAFRLALRSLGAPGSVVLLPLDNRFALLDQDGVIGIASHSPISHCDGGRKTI